MTFFKHQNMICGAIIMIQLQFLMTTACNIGYYEDQQSWFKCNEGCKSWDSEDPSAWKGIVETNSPFKI